MIIISIIKEIIEIEDFPITAPIIPNIIIIIINILDQFLPLLNPLAIKKVIMDIATKIIARNIEMPAPINPKIGIKANTPPKSNKRTPNIKTKIDLI